MSPVARVPNHIEMGALAPPLAKQCRWPDMPDIWQRSADAITLLMVRGYLTEAETHRARNRLVKDLYNALAARHEQGETDE